MSADERGSLHGKMQNKTGVIIKGLGGLYTVFSEGRSYNCSARGIFRKQDRKPMIGDLVSLAEINDGDASAVIQTILPRRNSLVRPAVANVDQIVIVMAAGSPAPDLYLIDKLLAAANLSGIAVVLLINKLDQDETQAALWEQEYRHAVSRVICTCTLDGRGMDSLRPVLFDKISVLAGQSGAGKSSVINLLLGDRIMETGGLSKKTERGRHTTRHNEMFPIFRDGRAAGFVIDSPGFSLFDLTATEPLGLQNLYPEIYNNKSACYFPDCSHTGEPGCFVPELVEKGLFGRGRYERYVLLYKELKEREKYKYK